MRYFTIGLILFFISNKSIAQNFTRIKVPEVKESKRIDSLIAEAINLSKIDSSYLHIEVLSPNSNDYGFWIYGRITNVSVIDLGEKLNFDSTTLVYKDNLRFFKYKNILVLVSGVDEPYGFFSKTKKSQFFRFLIERNNIDFHKNNLFYFRPYGYINKNFVLLHTTD